MFYEIHYSHFVENQNARNAKIRHTERNRTIEDLLAGKKTCPEGTIYQFGTLDGLALVEGKVNESKKAKIARPEQAPTRLYGLLGRPPGGQSGAVDADPRCDHRQRGGSPPL